MDCHGLRPRKDGPMLFGLATRDGASYRHSLSGMVCLPHRVAQPGADAVALTTVMRIECF